MRYRLRTLLILLAVGPPMLGLIGWPEVKRRYEAWQAKSVPLPTPALAPKLWLSESDLVFSSEGLLLLSPEESKKPWEELYPPPANAP